MHRIEPSLTSTRDSRVSIFSIKPLIMVPNLKNIQGDLYSKGFPKFNETYYFFTIGKPKDFSKALKQLVEKNEISTLETVQAEWGKIELNEDENKKQNKTEPTKDALIAFSMQGLRKASVFRLEHDIIIADSNLCRYKMD